MLRGIACMLLLALLLISIVLVFVLSIAGIIKLVQFFMQFPLFGILGFLCISLLMLASSYILILKLSSLHKALFRKKGKRTETSRWNRWEF